MSHEQHIPPIPRQICVDFIDGIIVYSRNIEEENKNNLEIILQTLTKHKIYAKYGKCEFFKEEIWYLGHVITKDGIDVDQKKIKTIMEWIVPKNVVDIRSFMGLAGYYRQFVEGFSKLAYPITSLQKKGMTFKWIIEYQNNFDQLKLYLS